MRGKNIIWLPLIAMLFTVLLMNTGVGAAMPWISVEPEEISGLAVPQPGPDGIWGNEDDIPGGRFSVDVYLDKATDLYTYGFALKIAEHAWTLVVTSVTEGPFLGQGGYETDFYYHYDAFAGYIYVTGTRLGPETPGVSGSGVLATVGFAVAGPGESHLDLVDVELFNSDGESTKVTARSGYYHGPYVDADKDSLQCLPGRAINVAEDEAAHFTSTVTNFGTMPLYVKTQVNIWSEDTLRTVHAGQVFIGERPPIYLYVNEYNDIWVEGDWINPGASVIGEPDGDYTESIVAGAITSVYGFEDLTLGPYDQIDRVVLEGYCQYPNGPTDAVDIDIYSFGPVFAAWLGSLYGGTDWAWVTPRWIDADVSDELPDIRGGDPTFLNSLSVFMYNYEGDAANPMRVDALRLRVHLAAAVPAVTPVYEIGPGETVVMPEAIWAANMDVLGRYNVDIIVWFSHDEATWIPATTHRSMTIKVFYGE